MGRRRPWLIFAQGAMVLTIGAMAWLDDPVEQMGSLTALVLVHNVFASLQDVATDALAVDLLAASERGRAQGMMFGSAYFGSSLGGAGLGTLAGDYGLHAALAVQAAALGLIMLLPLVLRERAEDRWWGWRGAAAGHGTPAGLGQFFRALGQAFACRAALWGVAAALLVKLAAGAFSVLAATLLVQRLGWSDTDYSQAASVGSMCGLAGAVLGGLAADRWGARQTAAGATMLLGSCWMAFGLAQDAWSSRPLMLVLMCSEGLLISGLSAALFATFMGISAPAVAATQFTAYMALLNLSQTLGSGLAGMLDVGLDLSRAGLGHFALLYAGLGLGQALVGLVILRVKPAAGRPPAGRSAATADSAPQIVEVE
jgi:PAT family beta-lactamase induction signal transducer AmpG